MFGFPTFVTVNPLLVLVHYFYFADDPSAVEAINGILGQKWQLRQMNLLQQDASYRHYEEVVSAVVRNPGDGQQTEDDNDLIVLPANEANMKKNPKSIQDQVKAGSSGITPFKGTTYFYLKVDIA